MNEPTREEIEKALGLNVDVNQEKKKENSSRKKIPTKIKVPFHVVIAWEDLEPSIASAFKKSKWPSKYASFQIFKKWFDKLPKKGE